MGICCGLLGMQQLRQGDIPALPSRTMVYYGLKITLQHPKIGCGEFINHHWDSCVGESGAVRHYLWSFGLINN